MMVEKRFGVKKNILFLPGIELLIFQTMACRN
jgi:hypothetical protein